MAVDVALLKEICETPGAPGYEKPIRDLIISKIKKYVDDLYIDNHNDSHDNDSTTNINNTTDVTTTTQQQQQ